MHNLGGNIAWSDGDLRPRMTYANGICCLFVVKRIYAKTLQYIRQSLQVSCEMCNKMRKTSCYSKKKMETQVQVKVLLNNKLKTWNQRKNCWKIGKRYLRVTLNFFIWDGVVL